MNINLLKSTMPENSSSYKHTSISFSPFIEENPYSRWSFWGAIITVCAVAITIAVATAGLTFGWPLAIAVLGALFTVFLFSAANSHNNTTERNKELAQRKEHEKELAKQQEIEKQTQKDKEVARQIQMKEEEAQMEKYEKTYTKFTTAARYTDANNQEVQQPTQQELQKQLQSLVRAGWIECVDDLVMWKIINSNIKSIAEFRFKEGGEINAVRINHNMDGQEYTEAIVVNPINPNAPKNIQKKIEEKNKGR